MAKKKVMLVCEPPSVNTGFGVVSRTLAKSLSQEYQVFLFSTGGKGNVILEQAKDICNTFGIYSLCTTYPDNAHGTNFFDMKLREFEPACVYIYYDTGSIGEYVTKTHLTTWPTAAYMMVEGTPLMAMWRRMFNDIGYKNGWNRVDFTLNNILLPSKIACEDAFRETGRECDYAYHGVDHANFRQLVPQMRKELRQQLAQDLNDPSIPDSFIYMYNARNVERKAWPRVFRALKVAQELSPNKPIKLLAHTKVFDNFKLGGWALSEEVEKAGLDPKSVIWTMDQSSETDANSAMDHGMPFDVPDSAKSVMSLVKLYNTANAYIHPSCVEAAGIPILEAAKCGLPVLTTDYSSGGEYGRGVGAVMLPVNDWWYHASGMAHALVDIPKTGEIMAKLANNASLQYQLSAASLKGSSLFSWDDLAKKSVISVEAAIKDSESKKLKF